MAFEIDLDKHSLSIPAASDINPYTVVTIAGTSAWQTFPAASMNLRPFGAVREATYLRGEIAAVWHDGNVMKLRCAASVGAGQEVAVASSNGAVGPQTLISASGHWAVGVTCSPAAAGEIVSVYIAPRKA